MRGRYTAWSLRETSPARRRRFFRDEGSEVVLDESIRRAVRFEQRNLSVEDAELWSPGAYDVVFCRNVLMYFEPDRMRQAIDRIARSLAPGGFLFLGHAETLRGVSEDFHLCHTHEAFYYQRKDALHPPAAPQPVSAPARVAAEVVLQIDGTFVDAIRGASERVAALMPGAAEPAAVPPWDAAPALDLLRRERFAEALQAIQARPAALARDPDLLLLEAMLLTHDGKIAVADEACRTLLAVDELNAGAHYVLALCGEHAGALDDAAEHDRIAAYLDPGFAMPRLHLGLLARRAGEREAARRELTQALFLLEREDPARLLLFGGGFNREALVGLCNLALKDCGGRA
jgi:chemotaxis protein methyltransferase CheR